MVFTWLHKFLKIFELLEINRPRQILFYVFTNNLMYVNDKHCIIYYQLLLQNSNSCYLSLLF
jgi:hypothetical protein